MLPKLLLRRALFSVTLLLALGSARAAYPPCSSNLDAIIAASRSVTTNLYPDADRVIVDSFSHEEYHADGTSSSTSSDAIKLLTEAGRRAAQLQQFYFNLSYGTVTVSRATIIKSDGRRIEVDIPRASRVMTETGQMAANIYDPNNKILQLSLADLEIDDTVVLDVARKTWKARVPGVWADYSLFEYTMPIRRISYHVTAPAALPLRHLQLRDPVADTVTSSQTTLDDGRIHYAWEVRDVPQAFGEPNMPPLHTVVQRLIVSTAADWPALSRWYWELSLPRLEATIPEIQQQVDTLIANTTSPQEKTRRIFTWVSQNIRYMGITTETEAPGYEPHDVSMTFSNRYGVCRDKAALLVTMLRQADLEAYPVLIHVGAKLDPDVPMTFFNHAIVAVKLPDDDDYTLMDPTNETTRDLCPAYLGNRSFLVAHPQGEILRVSPVSPADENLVKVVTHGQLDEVGRLTLATTIDFDGINDVAYRGHFARLPREQRRRFFERLVKARLAGAELTDCTITPEEMQETDTPLQVRLGIQVKEYPVVGRERLLLDLPWLSGSLGFANQLLGQTGLQTRRFDLETELACGLDEQFTIDLGSSVAAPLILPHSTTNDAIGILYQRSVTVSDQLLQGHLHFALTKPSYPAADYATLRQLRRDMEYAARQRAHFLPGTLAATPDMEVVEDSLSIQLDSPHAWTTTQRQVYRILTYAGKKRFSEIKLHYNPVWQTAELLSCVVSNANGTVHYVKPEEINDMDAPWSGSAPRYPAGRTRVISLPGVETGSTVVVTTRHTQQDHPGFALQRSFRSFEPIRQMSLEITAPDSLQLQRVTDGFGITATSLKARDHTIWRWSVTNQPPLPREEALPPAFAHLPTVRLSCATWHDYASAVKTATQAALRDATQTQALTRKLLQGIDEPAARVTAIRDHVMRNIRAAGPNFTELPLAFTPVDETLRDGYGHDFDRALLLVAMLRAAGYNADPILVDPGQTMTPLAREALLVPDTGRFSATLVAVTPRRPGLLHRLFGSPAPLPLYAASAPLPTLRDYTWPPLYLNDGDQYAIPGTTHFSDHPALTLDGGLREIEVVDHFRTRVDNDWTIELDADGHATIHLDTRYFGTASGAFRKRISEMPPEKLRRHFQELVGGISQAAQAIGDLETDLDSYPACQRLRVTAPRYAVRDGHTLTLLLPGGEGALFPLGSDRRDNPLWLQGGNQRATTSSRILLPATAKAVLLAPENNKWQLPGKLGTYQVRSRTRRQADGTLELVVERTIERGAGLLPAEQYPALLELNRRLAHPSLRTVVVELQE